MDDEELVQHMREDPEHPMLWVQPVPLEGLQAIQDEWHASYGPQGLYTDKEEEK